MNINTLGNLIMVGVNGLSNNPALGPEKLSGAFEKGDPG